MLGEVEDEMVEETDSTENSSFDGEIKQETLKKIKNKWNDIVGNNVEIVVSVFKIYYKLIFVNFNINWFKLNYVFIFR